MTGKIEQVEVITLFTWRRLYAEGALSPVGAGEEVVPASEYPALQHQVRELQRLLGRRHWRVRDPARSAGSGTTKKTAVPLTLAKSGRHAVNRVAQVVAVARSNLMVQTAPGRVRQGLGRRPLPDAELLGEIKEVIAVMSTYGYRRVHALIRRRRQQQGGTAVNVKRVYPVMTARGLLLERPSGSGAEGRDHGRVPRRRPGQVLGSAFTMRNGENVEGPKQ